MSFDVQKLFSLLPSFYRIRDAEIGERLGPGQDGPLRALLAVIAEQAEVMEGDLEQLYDNQFIETCAEWVVPYIGDLVSARGLVVYKNASFSQRRLVAHTLADRRRKGTASGLEQLARDVSDWQANLVEYFQRLVTTQCTKHVRPANFLMPNLRQWEPLDRIRTPFDRIARLPEVRRISTGHGLYNIPNIGVFLWGLDAHPSTKSPAYKVDDHRFLFDALGKTTPLFTRWEVVPKIDDSISRLAAPINVPAPITRRVLDRYMALYYGTQKSISVNVNGVDIDISQVRSCDLSDAGAGAWAQQPGKNYLIDPVLGRLLGPASLLSSDVVLVTFHYGFSTDMGGGEYTRQQSFLSDPRVVVVPVVAPATIHSVLSGSMPQYSAVEIRDNGYHAETPLVRAPRNAQVELRAHDKARPTLLLGGDLLVEGEEGSQVFLNGLVIAGNGRVRVPAKNSDGTRNQLTMLCIQDCTLLPGASPAITLPGTAVPALSAQPPMVRLAIEAPGVVVQVTNSILGSIRCVDGAEVHLTNSIVDASDATEVAFSGLYEYDYGATLYVENTSVVGQVRTAIMRLASNTIFLAAARVPDLGFVPPVASARVQQGCVRFSYLPPGVRLPRRYKCQPASDADAQRVRPVFTSLQYGDPGYLQLNSHCPAEIRSGADDGGEMGVFHDVHREQRVRNLEVRLEEYLRFGLEAGVFLSS